MRRQPETCFSVLKQRGLIRLQQLPELTQDSFRISTRELYVYFARSRRPTVGQVDDVPARRALDCGVRRLDEAAQPLREPVIPPSKPVARIHPLLDDCPIAIVADHESVQVDVESVLDRRAVNL